MTQDWFLEKHTPYAGLTLAVRERLHTRNSEFQQIEVLETVEFGRMLLLDGFVMLTARDEFIYHEMIVHPPLLLHGAPKRVLVIGGGDGGSVREALRHASVEWVTLVEIDPAVIETCRRFFPELANSLDDPRAEVVCQDGFAYLDQHPDAYDAIIVDSIDPVGEGAKLFTTAFYEKVKGALRAGGVAVFQTESPFYNGEVLAQVNRKLTPLFAHVAPFLAHIPTYPSGLWSFTFASNHIDPSQTAPNQPPPFQGALRYFNVEMCKAAFALPGYIRESLGEE
ncbi:MAG: polyamine aminopropyltransferase [bacterium]